MGFFRFGKKLHPKYFFGLSTHIIFVGESIKSGGASGGTSFFLALIEDQIFDDFHQFWDGKVFGFQIFFPCEQGLVHTMLGHNNLNFHPTKASSQNRSCLGAQNPYFQAKKEILLPRPWFWAEGQTFYSF